MALSFETFYLSQNASISEFQEMQKISIFVAFIFLVIAFLLSAACKPGTGESVTPDGAQQILQLRGYEVNSKGYFKAIEGEDLAAIRTFHQADFDPNTFNEKGDTPMTFAVACCELKTVKAVAEKADINARDKNSRSPLYLAYYKKRKDIFNYLLEINADVKVPGNNVENTMLHLAATYDDFETIKKLVDRGADVNAVETGEGAIPLIQSCIGRQSHLEIVKYFLEKGAQIDQQGKNGGTCLIYAAANGQAETVTELLKAGAKKDLRDANGHDAVWWAKKGNYGDVVKILSQ
jgi:ankyrin repeat protein